MYRCRQRLIHFFSAKTRDQLRTIVYFYHTLERLFNDGRIRFSVGSGDGLESAGNNTRRVYRNARDCFVRDPVNIPTGTRQKTDVVR